MKCQATFIIVFFIISMVCSTDVAFGQGTHLSTIRP